MAKESVSRFKKLQNGLREFLEEKGIVHTDGEEPSRLRKFLHFWLMVGRSFSRNRCPVHASALAYATLLALIPMLAVAISVSSSILKNQGDEKVEQFIDNFVGSAMPSVQIDTNTLAVITNAPAASTTSNAAEAAPTRKVIVDRLKGFVQNIQSGTLGFTGSVLLVFVAINMLSRIEATFNDIWGVSQGRSWSARIVQYWAVISLGPVLLGLALGLTSGPHFASSKRLLVSLPSVGPLIFNLLPVIVLCLAFSAFYMLMPNTKVHWKAALVGGMIGGVLWHLNNYFSVLYVSRWVTNSKIYGSLAVIPVFMLGLYFSWLIMLFGAQVAYAYQNRASYLQEKMVENVSQRGREFVALRIMQCIAERFQLVQPAPTVPEIAARLVVPTKLVQQVAQTLVSASLVVVTVANKELAYAPARPLDMITCHDILLAMRASQGQELATRDEPARTEVYGEFEKILEAERKAASAVTVLTMVNRTEALAAVSQPETKAVGDSKT